MADVLKPVSAGQLTLTGIVRAAVAGFGFFAAGTVVAQTCSVPTVVASFAAPTNVRQMVYSPAHNRLVIRNSGSAIAAIDATTGQSTLKLSNTNFTDLAISPSGRYVFGADYGGKTSVTERQRIRITFTGSISSTVPGIRGPSSSRAASRRSRTTSSFSSPRTSG